MQKTPTHHQHARKSVRPEIPGPASHQPREDAGAINVDFIRGRFAYLEGSDKLRPIFDQLPTILRSIDAEESQRGHSTVNQRANANRLVLRRASQQ